MQSSLGRDGEGKQHGTVRGVKEQRDSERGEGSSREQDGP